LLIFIGYGLLITQFTKLNYVSVVDKPTNIVISNVVSTSLTITWSASDPGGGAENISGYVIRWNSIVDEETITSPEQSCCEYSLNSLKSNTKYSIIIVAKTMQGNTGAPSDVKDTITSKIR